MSKTVQLVRARKQTHGDFRDHARIAQGLKSVMHDNGFEKLTAMQKEALEMIAHNIGSILAGNANHADHWDAIAGYAQITSDRLDVEA